MYTYRNSKGATITTACKMTGGGWVSVSSETKKETRTEEVKEVKTKRKKNE